VQWLKSKIGAIFAPQPEAAPPRAPEGMTIYAVGDIHGRADLLEQLLDQISADVEATRNERTVLAFLGDYVDRGPQSRTVIQMLMQLKDTGEEQVMVLKGNHEEALLGFLADAATGPGWADHGGRETLLSYGVAVPKHRTDTDAWAKARDDFAAALPAEHLAFLRNLSLCESIGDYVFVHAGVRPGVPLHEQEERDLLWIREEFLQNDRAMDKMVVHGHTPVEQPSLAPGRIGIDTGAYATGILTALKLHGEHQVFLQTGT
jgi:serine/threonine protein phosphatase 1